MAVVPEAERRRGLREWPHAEQRSRTTAGWLCRVDPEHRLERIHLVYWFYGVDPVGRIRGIDPVDRLGGLVRLGALGRLVRQRRLGPVGPVLPVHLGLAVPGGPFLAEHGQLGFLAGGEQEVGQERDAVFLGVEPGDPLACRLVEHVTRPQDRRWLAVDLVDD